MSEDIDVAPHKFPRHYTNIPNIRKSSDKNIESLASRGPGASVGGSNPPKMNQTKPNECPGEDRQMAGNKQNMPHLSRSRSFRESFHSGGFSAFKEFDPNSTPMFQITPISAGDFKLSDDPVAQIEAHKSTLTETITSLGIEAMPAPGVSRPNSLSDAFNEFGFNPELHSRVPAAPAVESWNADTQETSATANSRQKQRARSEPAGPRKPVTYCEDFSDNVLKSMRSPGPGSETQARDSSTSPLKLFNGSTMNEPSGHLVESNLAGTPMEKPNVYLHTLDSQIINVSDTGQKSKGKRKRTKTRNPECFIPILTANMENNIQKGSSPEKHSMFLGEDHMKSLTSPRGVKFNESSVDKSPPKSPKKPSPKRESPGNSPRTQPSPRNIASPKGKPQPDPGNRTSPPKMSASGRGEGSPSSPKVGRDAPEHKRSASQDSPRRKLDSKSPPYKERNCEYKVSQPCKRKSRFCGQCYRPAFQGNLFKNLAQAVGCQLACIANCNQRYQAFPGIQGLYTPEVEVQSLFNQQPYTVCDGWEEPPTAPASRKEVRSAPRRHGTPAFYSNRRHSSESFRYRGAKGSEYRQRGVSQQAPQSRRFLSASESRYQTYGRDYTPQDDKQLRFELKQISQSSDTSMGDNHLDSSQSTEPPGEHSLAESRYSGSRSRKNAFGSEIRMQRSGTDTDKKFTGNVSPRSFESEDDDHSIGSRKSARSTERRSKHDVRQSRRASEVSQRLDVIPREQSMKQTSSGSEDRLQTDSEVSVTNSEQQFLDRTRQVLEESFKGPHICSRRFGTSERVASGDVIHVSKGIQSEEDQQSEHKSKEEKDDKKSCLTTDEELSGSERKPIAGRRTSVAESRRANRTHFRDRSQEYVLEVSRPPVAIEDQITGSEERKDVYSVGDRVRDGGGGVLCEPRSEIQGSLNTNIQVYTSLYSHGNPPRNAEDCTQGRCLSGKQDFKDSQKMPPKPDDWPTERESDHSARQSSDGKRSECHRHGVEKLGSNIPYDSVTKEAYSDVSRSNLAGKRASCQEPHVDTLYDQTTPEHSVSSRYSYDLSEAGQLGLPDDHRKPNQRTSYERKRAGRKEKLGSSLEESKPGVPIPTEREKRRIPASDQRVPIPTEREKKRIPASDQERISRHHESKEEAAPRPTAFTDNRGPRRVGPSVNGTSSQPPSVPATDCSSVELTVPSCISGRDSSAAKISRRSRELHEVELRAVEGVNEVAHTSTRQPTQGYRERSELRPPSDSLPERDASRKTSRTQSKPQTVEYSCTESTDDANSQRAAEHQGRSSVESKHSSRHRRSKRDYDSAYDDDMDEGVSQEDASTSISRQLPVEGLLDYDQRSQEETKSLRERSQRAMHFGNIVERNCYSERLSTRASSLKYETRKRIEGKHGNLENYSPAELKDQSSGVRVKSTPSRSSHSINSRDDEEENVHGREASIRDSLVTMRENKKGRGSKEWRHRQRKIYSSADTRSTTGNDTHDEEDSENTLPASPGDLESDNLDEETEERARSGRHAHHKTHRGAESDPRRVPPVPSGHHDSQDESHNSSSCLATPPEAYWDTLRACPTSTCQGELVRTDRSVHKYLEFLASKSAMTVDREGQHGEPFYSDSCIERRCWDTRSCRNRHRNYCDGNSSVHQTDRSNAQTALVQLRSHIRTRSPKFQYYRKKSPLKVEDDDDDDDDKEDDGSNDDGSAEDDTVVNKTRSRSNSARCQNRSRRCREGKIDLFEQIIIPEQPLQVDEYRHMHSFRNGVPFFCESLRVSTDLPKTSKPCLAQSQLSKSVAHSVIENETPQLHGGKSQLSSCTDSVQVSSAKKIKPVLSGRRSFMHLKSLFIQSKNEKVQIYPHRRAETQSQKEKVQIYPHRSAVTQSTVRPGNEISRFAGFDEQKKANVFSPACPNNDFEPKLESNMRTKDTPTEDSSHDLVLSCNVVSLPGNKNFSSNADRDRNSSSGNGDSLYPEYAYRCGVIDTLRILDSDLALSTPSAEFVHPCRTLDNTSESCMRHHQIEDHLTYIMQSFPALTVCKQNDETFEIIRENSLRALVYAAKLSVDWQPAHFYDKSTGNLENWIREVTEYSSTSNVSSVSETDSFDANTGNEKSRIGQYLVRDNKDCHLSNKSLKCCVNPSLSSLPKDKEFDDKEMDEETGSSPDGNTELDDEAQNRGSQQTPEDSELTEPGDETAEGEEAGLAHSESPTYLSDSDAHVYTEQGSNSDITNGADHYGHGLGLHQQEQQGSSCSYKTERSSNTNHDHGVVTQITETSHNVNLTNPESSRIRLHKAELSPLEEDRLRKAISRKLGSQKTFALIPVTFSESLMSAVQCVCHRSRESYGKGLDPTTDCVVPPGRLASDRDIQEIFDDICNLHCSFPPNTMAFYVVAVDKKRDDDYDARRADFQIGGKQPHMAPCAADGDGKPKQYYIYTKEELIKALAKSLWGKCDLVKPSEQPQQQLAQEIVDDTPNRSGQSVIENRPEERPDFQSIIQRYQQSMDTRSDQHAQAPAQANRNVQVDLLATGRDSASAKGNIYFRNISEGHFFAIDQSKQSESKFQHLEKQEKCESLNSNFRVSISANTSPGFTVIKRMPNEDAKNSNNETGVLSNDYKHQSERRSNRETREHGGSASFSHCFTVHNNETSVSSQSKERAVLENVCGPEKRSSVQACSYFRDTVNTSEVHFLNRQEYLQHSDLPDKCTEHLQHSDLLDKCKEHLQHSDLLDKCKEHLQHSDLLDKCKEHLQHSDLLDKCKEHLQHSDLPDKCQISAREDKAWATDNHEVCKESDGTMKHRLSKEVQPSEGRDSCWGQTRNHVDGNAATNKCSSSSSSSSSRIKTCRKSKSYSDLDSSEVHEYDGSGKPKRKRDILPQHKTLSLLETLVDGHLIAFFNNALKKITSPKHTICLRIAGDSGNIREDISKSQPAPRDWKKNYDSALSSEEDQDMTSPSAVSATETTTEKSLTEESVVVLSLPAETSDRRKRGLIISPATKKQRSDKLQEWVNNLTPEMTRLKSKCGRHTEKYVLLAKRKKLEYKGRRRYRFRRRAHKEVQSSESGNITNSANEYNESEASDIRNQRSPAITGADRKHPARHRRLRKRPTSDSDNNHSPGRRASGTTSRSRRRRDSRKPTTRSETRYRSPSQSLPLKRKKRVKNGSLDSRRKSRSKDKNSKRTSPRKSPKVRHQQRPAEVKVDKLFKENTEVSEPPLPKSAKTFSTSGISRIARALNDGHCQNVRNDESCDEARSRHPGLMKNEDRKRVINRDGTPEKDQVRIPISDDDSMAGCDPFESCLLTPIKEESQSHDYTGSEKSKSDFEAFVSRCRTKLLGITSELPRWMYDHSEGFNTRKANCTMSCSNFSGQRSSSSSGNHGSEDTDSCESRRQYSRYRLRDWCCPNHEPNYDCDISDQMKRTIPHTREYSFSYFQYVVPYKSAFLRQQMQELIQEDAPIYRKEDELLKMYATGNSRGQCVNNARGNLTIPWALRQANTNMSWRKSEENRTLTEVDPRVFTRSVPGVRCPQTRAPSASVSQTRTPSSHYTPYRPGYLRNMSPQMRDYPDLAYRDVRTHLVSGDRGRCSNYSSDGWLSGHADYHDLVHRNWNESANNGSDGSSSGDISGNEEVDMRDGDQRGEYPKRSQMKGKAQGGDAMAGVNDRAGTAKPSKDPRICHGKPNHYIKQSRNGCSEDALCMCRDHGCKSYDFLHQNYPVARVSNFAARNINGSGNMFGRGLNPSDDRLSAVQDHEADSEDEFNSATEELTHYSSSCRKRPKYGRKGQEIDDTCNHPESMSYYMGDGPPGQYDNFEGLPKEDLLINLSPVNTDDEIMYRSRHPKTVTCQRAPPSEASGQASAGVSKQGRNDCDMRASSGMGHQMDKNPALTGRSCYGQGDILNKRVFTQWYVDEGEKAQQSQRRPLVSVAQAEKCLHRERWMTPTEHCDSSGDDGEQEDDDDENNDCEDEDDEGDENDDEDEGEVEDDDDDDEDDDEEEEDDENEEDDEEEDDEDEHKRTPGQNLCEDDTNLKEKPRCLNHMKEKNAQNNYHHEKPQDINESKIVGHRIANAEQMTKRPTRVRTLTHTKRYTTANKQGHQQSTGDHLTKSKQAGMHEKNMHVKPASGHQHKFSLEQIKVPAIEKERVRFACDENGDWAEIGRGSYGCVYLGLLDGVVEVAIKDFYESSSWDLVIHEARMLMFLQDTGITPKFYGLRRRFDASKQPSEYCIIMEYFGDGRTLFNVMSDKMVLAGDEWMDIVGQLVAGLRLIHRKNVLINDLKADNILIDLTGGRKIIRYIDVGMATYKQGLTFQLPQDQMSKYNFLAPEVREGARTTTRSDIYSLGYMLEQMCRMADSTLGGLRKLVARCMEKNPARRPDIDDIVSQVHRFIASKASIVISSSSPREQFVLTNSV